MDSHRRSKQDRRSGKDRRRSVSILGLFYKGPERRTPDDRRINYERRKEWIRISKWSSAPLKTLKIAKYLLRKTRLTKNNPYNLE
jgi:hypothetical protein